MNAMGVGRGLWPLLWPATLPSQLFSRNVVEYVASMRSLPQHEHQTNIYGITDMVVRWLPQIVMNRRSASVRVLLGREAVALVHASSCLEEKRRHY